MSGKGNIFQNVSVQRKQLYSSEPEIIEEENQADI